MKERPILFSGAMVRALLAGVKTQTRRVLKPPSGYRWLDKNAGTMINDGGHKKHVSDIPCPHGQAGDRLWVREAFRPIYPQQASYNGGRPIGYDYCEGYKLGYRLGDLIASPKWKPSIFMPREACRIVLEIVSIRVERLNSISDKDALAEGVGAYGVHSVYMYRATPYERFRILWESLNGAGSWTANPWVWVIEFKRVEGGAQ